MNENVAASTAHGAKGPAISMDLPPIGLLSGLFASSVGYAFLLNTQEGRRWDKEHTWFVVVIGVMLTLGWLAINDSKAALKAFACFIVSGIPMIARALFLQNEEKDSLINRNVR